MKVAMWAVFIFMMGIVGVVLINIFGNITTTNQQDYTLIKNTVEASMYDSIDMASYRAGFYVCTNQAKDETGKISFERVEKCSVTDLRGISSFSSTLSST